MADIKQGDDDQDVFLTPDELVERWNNEYVTGTLANWRSAGKGPSYTKLGKTVLYPLRAVVAYERQGTVN